MLNFLEATAPGATGSMGSFIVTMALMIAALYFFMIIPEKKKKKKEEEMRSALKNGDKVTTIGGIVGTVVNVKEDKFVIETGADQVRIEFAKWALSSNETANAAAASEAKKAQEEKAKAKAAKKAEKNM